MVRPEFFTDADLGDLPPTTRLLFIGMWTLADRDGRLRDRPRDIKRALLPTDEFNAEEAIQQLTRIGSIRRYEVDGEHYIDIPGFATYQHVHPHEAPSTIPPFKFSRAKKDAISREAVTLHGEPCNVSTCPCTSTSTSTSTEDLDLSTLSESSDITPRSRPNIHAFNEFWKHYPKKAGKQTALKKWKTMDRVQRERAIVISQAVAFAVVEGYRELEFVPMASTFLNAARYDDWYDDDGSLVVPGDYAPSGNGKTKQRSIDDSIERAINSVEWPEEAT